jgi:hypothetical protein
MTNVRQLTAGLVILVLGLTVGIGLATAQSLPAPEGRVILTLAGDIEVTNQNDVAAFDAAMLKDLGEATVETSTAWTEGVKNFRGVAMDRLMERVGASGSTAVVIALNDYKVEIPTSDFRSYPVVLAYEMDGERLRIRDKGPLWVVYPQDQYPALQNKETQAKWVWQVKRIEFR